MKYKEIISDGQCFNCNQKGECIAFICNHECHETNRYYRKTNKFLEKKGQPI